MSMICKGEEILDNIVDIEHHVVDYYSGLFASENSCVQNDLINTTIPNLVTSADNALITSLPSMEEIKNAVFSMNAQGATGPDGFGGCFFPNIL